MRLYYLFGIIFILLDGFITQPVFSCTGEDCDDEASEESDITNKKSYGSQEVTRLKGFGAILFKPVAQSGNQALHHFRNIFREEESEESATERPSFVRLPNFSTQLKGLLGTSSSVEENDNANDNEEDAEISEEYNYDTAGASTEDLQNIDLDDPEIIASQKELVDRGFSRILAINKEARPIGLSEGDMKLIRGYNAAKDVWPKSKSGPYKNMAVIPYKMSPKYNRTEVATIKSAMELYRKHTCIRFVPRKSERAFIFITDAKGCWAYVGKTGYASQTVSLGKPGCVSKGIAAHEFMHVVGFQHEHSRTDRDKYVQVLEQNIQKDMKPNFEVHNDTRNLVIYDYNSVMHYGKNAFSKYQYLPAIQVLPKRKPFPEIGQRERMSPYDIEEIKYLYNCAESTYQRCGKDFFNVRSDSFSSPNHPKNYPSESHCTWKITIPKGLYISLTFTDINIEDSKLCQKDAILVHDGPNGAAPQLKVICGRKSAATTVVSTGNTLFVIFASDPTKSSFTGFKASFKTTHSKGVRPKPYKIPELPPIRNPERSFKCDFDSGTCGMTQDTLDELDWIRYRGATPSQGTGPRSDHTTGSGHYMYVESSLPSKLGDNAILRTPWMTRQRASCVGFSYHMYGVYMGTLRLYAFEKRRNDAYGHEVLLWERHGNQGNHWITENVTYRPKSTVQNVQFYWEAYVFIYQSDFGLDDISINNDACPPKTGTRGATTPRVVLISPTSAATTTTRTTTRKPTTPKTTTAPPTTVVSVPVSPVDETSCDFDTGSGLCGWTQSATDDFDWDQTSGGTPSHNTGPTTGDHTSSVGKFLFIEASTPRVVGDVARLLSPRLSKKPHCLQIWYHMYGTQMGALVIKKITDGVETKLIEKVGNMGDKWHYAEIDVITPSVKRTVARWKDEAYTQIAIDGVRGSGYSGDLAIDDITITSSPCVTSTLRIAKSAVSLPRSLKCNFDNKNDLCGFSNDMADSFDWTQNSGETHSGSTGPSADHTQEDSSGYYMYIEASSPRTMGDSAKLISPKLATGKYCAEFWVHMWGSGMGDVRVYTAEFLNDLSELRQKRWEMSGSQGNAWVQVKFEFETAINIQYVQLEFEGVIGHTFTSDAALDDISVTSGRCRDSTGAIPTTKRPYITRRPSMRMRPVTTRPPTTATTRKPKPTTKKTTTTTTTTTPKPTTVKTTPRPKKTTTTPRPTTTRKTTTTPKPTTTRKTTTTPKPTTTRRTTTTVKPTTTKEPLTKRKTTTTPRPTTTRKKTTTAKPTTTKRPITKRKTITNKPRTTRRPYTTRIPKRKTTRPPTTTQAPRIVTKKPRPVVKTTRAPKVKPTSQRRPMTTRPKPTAQKRFRKPTVSGTKRYKTVTTKSTAVKKGTTTTKITRTKTTRPTTKTIRPSTKPNQRPASMTVLKTLTDFSCDFESGQYCAMEQSNVDKFDWIRHSGNTPSSGTGPINDHTLRTVAGHYLFIESSKPRIYKDNAVITTPPLSAKPVERCVVFWYHMHGTGVGKIRVYSELAKNGNFKKFQAKNLVSRKLEFEISGEKGSEWRMARFNVKLDQQASSSAIMRFHFEGVRGPGYRSDSAIDDICISSSSCSSPNSCTKPKTTNKSRPTTASNGRQNIGGTRPSNRQRRPPTRAAKPVLKTTRAPPKTTTRATTTKPIIPSSRPALKVETTTISQVKTGNELATEMSLCTFDTPTTKSATNNPVRKNAQTSNQDKNSDPLCGWEQEENDDDFNWIRKSGKTPSQYTGPNGDHTTGKGEYLFIESSAPRVPNDVAILKSKKMHPIPYCVELFYNLNGRGIGALAVRAQQEMISRPKIMSNLKIIKGQQGDSWGKIRVNYKPRGAGDIKHVQFRVEAIRGSDYMSDLAIDDLKVMPGKCESCLRPNKKFKDRFGQQKVFSTGCISTKMFYVKCCSLPKEKIVYKEVSKCSMNSFTLERLNWMCHYM